MAKKVSAKQKSVPVVPNTVASTPLVTEAFDLAKHVYKGCSLAGALLMRRFDGSLKRFGRKIESWLRFLEVLRRTWPPMCR